MVVEELASFDEPPKVNVGGISYTEDRVLGHWFPD
jgi:hypothetical protein